MKFHITVADLGGAGRGVPWNPSFGLTKNY